MLFNHILYSDVLQHWNASDTSAALVLCRAVQTKIVCSSFMAQSRRMLTLATRFKMLYSEHYAVAVASYILRLVFRRLDSS
jgi:hypothetical protein